MCCIDDLILQVKEDNQKATNEENNERAGMLKKQIADLESAGMPDDTQATPPLPPPPAEPPPTASPPSPTPSAMPPLPPLSDDNRSFDDKVHAILRRSIDGQELAIEQIEPNKARLRGMQYKKFQWLKENHLPVMEEFVAGGSGGQYPENKHVLCADGKNTGGSGPCFANYFRTQGISIVKGFNWFAKNTSQMCMERCLHTPDCKFMSWRAPNHCRLACTATLVKEQFNETKDSIFVQVEHSDPKDVPKYSQHQLDAGASLRKCEVWGEPLYDGYCHPQLTCPTKLPIAYMEVPKAACTSMKKWLASHYDDAGGWDGHGSGNNCCWAGSSRLKVVIMRNPYNLLLSFFKDKMYFQTAKLHSTAMHSISWKDPFADQNPSDAQLECYVSWHTLFPELGEALGNGTASRALHDSILRQTCSSDGDGMTLDEAFIYFVNIVIRLPDALIDNHVKSFPGSTLYLTEPSRPVSMDEFYVMHLEKLDDELKELNKDLCEHWGHCNGEFEPFPRENENKRGGAGSWKFEWPAELAELVQKRFGCLFGPFGYGTDPKDTGPKVHNNIMTADDIHRCLVPVTELDLFKLRVENKDDRHKLTLERYRFTADHSKAKKSVADFTK